MTKIKNTENSLCWRVCVIKVTNACGSPKLYSHFENQYGGFSENWESVYIKRHSDIIPGNIHKGYTIIPQGHLLNNVHSSIICNNQNLETI